MSTPFEPEASCQDPSESSELMPVADARAAMLSAMTPVQGRDDIALTDATGRVLAEDLVAPTDVPAHNNSAMDGYALRGVDLPSTDSVAFDVIGEAWAGKPFDGRVAERQAVKIATGAVMPAGADTVVINERVQRTAKQLHVLAGERAGANVRLAGEDLRCGDVALGAGTRLRAAEIGQLASLGIRRVSVTRRLRVALFSTGDELVPLESGRSLGPGDVFDSNRHSLRSALQALGVELRDLGIVPDDAAATQAAFDTAAADADAVIATGGASISDADHVAATLRARGEVTFWRVAMRPGRPLASGSVGGARF
ncbi:MAG: molybdopterin molybdotransferase MoeA, partial [Pseudomonadota bacterium]